jgi:two-component system nitrogen regulation response regulator NtrX
MLPTAAVDMDIDPKGSWSILFVEDNIAFRSMLADELEMAGFSVTPVGAADEALAVLRARRPDLIVLDLVMPSGTMQGIDFLAMIRGVEEWKSMPVVILSGYGDLVNPDVATRLGAAAVVSKPLPDPRALERTIRSILS